MRDMIIASLLMFRYAHCGFSLSIPEAVYQPEIELDFQHYRNHPAEMDFLVNCVLRGGECDAVGEWVKARIIHNRFKFGQCNRCTEDQTLEATKFINYFLNERQDIRQEVMNKYLRDEAFQGTHSLQSALKKPEAAAQTAEEMSKIVRRKRNLAVRRITIKNEMGSIYSPVSVVCQSENRDYMRARKELKDGEKFSFTIYDIGSRVFYCDLIFKGNLKSQTFNVYNGRNSTVVGKILLRPNGIYSKRPRKDLEKIFDWQ